jgi:TRAP-type mannitol/chloroaromatic compound transport system permease small subunit
VLETSPEGSGIPAVFLLKTLILVYAVLLGLQGIALGVRSALALLPAAPPRSAGGGDAKPL